MMQCWELDPDKRPSFSSLVDSLSQSLQGMANYMDIANSLSTSTDSEKLATNPDKESLVTNSVDKPSNGTSKEELIIDLNLMPEMKRSVTELKSNADETTF